MSLVIRSALTDATRAVLHDAPSLFLTPPFLDAVLAAYPRFQLTVLQVERDGVVVGVLPFMEARRALWREVVSLPFGCHGGAVVTAQATSGDLRVLLEGFRKRAGQRSVARFELVALDPDASTRHALREVFGEDHLDERSTAVLTLPATPEALWDSYDTRLRRSVRRAEEAGVTVERVTDAPALEAFYDTYRELSLTWDLSWRHPLPVLQSVLDSLGDQAQLWVARHAGAVVAGELTLNRSGQEFLTWIPGARASSRELRARHLLLHRLLETAIRGGYRTVHLGPSAGRRGLETFKTAFGARAIPLVHAGHQAPWVRWVQRVRW